MRITDLRMRSDLTMKQFAESLGVSLSTIARIEVAEEEGKKHLVSKRVAYHLTQSLGEMMKREIVIDELEGIAIAPKRPGRPKGSKKKEGEQT